MRDILTALDQRASAQVTVSDFEALIQAAAAQTIDVDDYTDIINAVAATGTIQINDYTKLNAAQATQDITISDYASMIAAAATGTIEITDYTQLEGAEFTVGGNTYQEGVHFDAVTSNNQTATNLAAVLDVDADFGAGAVGAVITVTAAAAGTAGNSIGMSTDAGGGVTLSGANLTGGLDHAVITVDGVDYTQGTDFNAATDNDTTASNLATAIDGGDQGAGSSGAVVTVTAASAGSAGNSIDTTGTGSGFSIGGATLEGGQDNLTINVNGTDLVAGTDFTAATSNDATATSLASAVDGVTGVGGAAVTDTVTATASAKGTAGNSIVLTSSDETNAAISGATLSGGVAGDTIVIGSDTLTFGDDMTAATSNDATATSIASAIDGLGSYSAAAVSAQVTATHGTAGYAGNSTGLTTTASGLTLGGATLEGGQDHGEVILNGTTLTQGTDFTAETDNDTTATNIATAMAGETGFTASATGAVATVYWETPGTAGNAKTLALGTNTQGASVSGATLEDGVAASYSETIDTEDCKEIEAALNISTLAGTTPTLDITPQASYIRNPGADDWQDLTAFTQLTASGKQILEITKTGMKMRFKYVLGGTNPLATGDLTCVKK